jgi:hypothetical protein
MTNTNKNERINLIIWYLMFYRFKFLNKTGDLIIVFKQFLQNFNFEMEVVF